MPVKINSMLAAFWLLTPHMPETESFADLPELVPIVNDLSMPARVGDGHWWFFELFRLLLLSQLLFIIGRTANSNNNIKIIVWIEEAHALFSATGFQIRDNRCSFLTFSNSP